MCFFGYPQVELDGTPVSIERRKTLALLAYLAITRHRVGREVLAGLFWPDFDAAQASAYLRHTLWELRKALGEAYLEADREAVALVKGDIWVDVVQYEELVTSGVMATDRSSLLEQAVALYRGEFLAGLTLRDSPDFDEWQSLQSEALRQRLHEALATLVELLSNRGELARGMEMARRWLGMDPLNEAAHRALMRLYAESGQQSAALRQYETCTSLLRSELLASPEQATTTLYQEIRGRKVGARAAAPPPPNALPIETPPVKMPSPAIALPAPPATPFLGRDTELAQIAHLLENAECRLITLSGPGGIGKTRLALEAARAAQEAYPSGVAFASLAAVDSGDALLEAISEPFQLSLSRGGHQQASADRRRRLLDHLRRQALLLVLDNAEHLATPTCEFLAELLPIAPRIKVLVTSRERLSLAEEWVLDIQGLGYPGPGDNDNLADYPAVQLFHRTAQRSRADLALEPADWLAIARICRAVEGTPLGIELAAPWVRVLSCEEIAQEIERDQDFLRSAHRETPERHRSLRAVFEHSWRLLGDQERELFRRLGVLQGSFTREAASQIAGATLADLSALLDKSLLRHVPPGRYDLHQALKQYASEKLAESPQVERQTRDRHAAYYLDLLCAMGEMLKGPDQQTALKLLEAEMANLRAAWYHAVTTQDWARVRRSLLVLALLGEMGAHPQEGGELIRSTIAAVRKATARRDMDDPLQVLLAFLLAVRRFSMRTLEPDLLQYPLIEESLKLVRELPDSPEKAMVYLLNSNGPPLPWQQARVLVETGLAIFQRLEDPWGLAVAQLMVADCTCFAAGEPAAARPGYQAARAAFRAMGNRWGEALCLFGLSYVAEQEGRLAEALDLARESLLIYQELGNPRRILDTLTILCQIAQRVGDLTTARWCLEESLTPQARLGQGSNMGATLSSLADVACQQEDWAAARRYLERALNQFREMGDRQGVYRMARRLDELAAHGDASSPGAA